MLKCNIGADGAQAKVEDAVWWRLSWENFRNGMVEFNGECYEKK